MTFVEDETTAMFDTFLTGLSMAAEEQREYVQKLKNGSRVSVESTDERSQMTHELQFSVEIRARDPRKSVQDFQTVSTYGFQAYAQSGRYTHWAAVAYCRTWTIGGTP